MSFFSSFQQFVTDAGSSISESARKLVNTSGSRDSPDHGDDDAFGPSISVAPGNNPRLHLPLTAKSSDSPSHRNSKFNLVVPPNVVGGATSPLVSPSVRNRFASPCKTPMDHNAALLSASAAAPNNGRTSRRGSSVKKKGRGSQGGSGEVDLAWQFQSSAVNRAREKSLQSIQERQKPKAKPKLYPQYTEVPEKWKEKTDLDTG